MRNRLESVDETVSQSMYNSLVCVILQRNKTFFFKGFYNEKLFGSLDEL